MVIKVFSGLGNQLFQISFGYYLLHTYLNLITPYGDWRKMKEIK